jgi:outer membrane protein assembly factor BamB
MRLISRVFLTALLLTVIILPVQAQRAASDWTQWRGPGRDGSVTGLNRTEWPPKLTLVWKVPVGAGYASPVVDSGRVFVNAREGDKEVVRALDLETGRVVWRAERPAPYAVNPAAASHGDGPKSTPLVYAGRLFTLGIDGVLTAHDARTGATAWRKTFAGRYPTTSPLYGAAMSPLIVDGLLVVHVGGHDGGEVLAIDPASAAERWRWNGDGPAYASPIAATIDGTRQIVTQTQRYLVGLSASSGALLWRVPFTVIYDQNIVTPVVWRDLVIFSGYQKGIFALRPRRIGGKWETERVWDNPELSLYMSSPVVHRDRLLGLTHRNRGQVFSMDPASGRVLWTSPGRQGDNAAILAADDVVLVLTTDADLLVIRSADSGFQVVGRYTVADSRTWAHPVVLPSGVIVRDERHLSFWRW